MRKLMKKFPEVPQFILVSLLSKVQKKLYNIAYYDQLSKLPNRPAFNEYANNLFEEQAVARIGGDEFAILCSDCMSQDQVVLFIKSLQHVLLQPFEYKNMPIRYTYSMGVVVDLERTKTLQTLFKNVDSALFHAKTSGKDKYSIYTSTIVGTIKANEIAPHYIKLEITETSVMENYDKAINNLKMDIEFTRNILNSTEDQSIVKSVINLAHEFKIPVTAEGIETKEQLDLLINFQCEYAQGYYFSKPIDALALEKLIDERSW